MLRDDEKQGATPVASVSDGMRLVLAFLGAAVLLTAACLAQAPTPSAVPPDVQKLVRDASFNELHSSDGHMFRYRVHTVDDGKSRTKEVIETRDGGMMRLLEVDGRPLDADANAKELARLQKISENPDEQIRKHKREQADNERSDEMVRLLPDAFLYTYLGMVAGPGGPCYRLRFEPNPNFTPPDREGAVYHGMAGELWIDQAQLRMARFQAHLTSDVDFGWGVVGRLFQGGTILVENRDVGEHHWETTREQLHITGKILMVKALKIDTDETSTDFQPVANEGFQAAIALLTKMPLG